MHNVQQIRQGLMNRVSLVMRINAWIEDRERLSAEEQRTGVPPEELHNFMGWVKKLDTSPGPWEPKEYLVMSLHSYWFDLMLDNFEAQVVKLVEDGRLKIEEAMYKPDSRRSLHYGCPNLIDSFLHRTWLSDFGECFQRVVRLYTRLAKIEKAQASKSKFFTEEIRKLKKELLEHSFS